MAYWNRKPLLMHRLVLPSELLNGQGKMVGGPRILELEEPQQQEALRIGMRLVQLTFDSDMCGDVYIQL